jgi:UDP-N-acetylglucosamine 2-epimerase
MIKIFSILGARPPIHQGHRHMVMLEQSASVVATDSGGVQKEAFFCGVPPVSLYGTKPNGLNW